MIRRAPTTLQLSHDDVTSLIDDLNEQKLKQQLNIEKTKYFQGKNGGSLHSNTDFQDTSQNIEDNNNDNDNDNDNDEDDDMSSYNDKAASVAHTRVLNSLHLSTDSNTAHETSNANDNHNPFYIREE
ncbi:BAF_collapsed_G0017680.mRNA.1.CDS.1 [Saccharomyces cerevisiae]|nr:CFA_G0017330.mRNA.1.CDS.1 [Saccharomyces cerevisiae]CAI4439330.1 CEQ_1a_G0016300.mRNA.1.CDS.1 [Saccharomyces cerevisiae]CAI4458603.1 AKH_1a_G0017130.mRNA.1.CDS.1 [Saccharomyces cerevisiae]CAI4956111.1 BAD_HP_G0033690.mRNA.1.CDS.1 [Saccharomyces cerevisiae]CAI5269385.1 BAF_HP2_G0017140.mRNA.1.CDS.1 [Saccharomyces cerevisiae]